MLFSKLRDQHSFGLTECVTESFGVQNALQVDATANGSHDIGVWVQSSHKTLDLRESGSIHHVCLIDDDGVGELQLVDH